MKSDSKGRGILQKLIVLGLATLSAGMALVLWFVMRDTLMTYLLYFSFDTWKIPVVDNFSFVLLGIGWLIFVFVVHHILTKAQQKHVLFSSFFIICSYQLLLLSICNGARLLLINQSGWILLHGVELAISLACLIIAYIWRTKKRFRDMSKSK